jgi:hypothetical protein
MKMPGFTAEASLYKRSGTFRSAETGGPTNEGVIPQMRLGGGFLGSSGLGASCIPTIDGGMWCCVPGPEGPICRWVPPPPIIWTLQ